MISCHRDNCYNGIFKKKIDAFLDEWFNSKNKKPLIIKGARQIGKVYRDKYIDISREGDKMSYKYIAYYW